jgi:hypothetical protein
MKTVTCNTLVWVRDTPHEAGTTFKVVPEPRHDKEVDQTMADAWARNGWLQRPNAPMASEGA